MTEEKNEDIKEEGEVRVRRSKTGLGLFAEKFIPKGEFIIEYTGELISNEEADRRGGKYLFELSDKKTIDGKGRENTARYINHSCAPNADAEIRRGKILIFSLRNIRPGEEVTFDYGEEYFDEFIKPLGCQCVKCEKRRQREKANG